MLSCISRGDGWNDVKCLDTELLRLRVCTEGLMWEFRARVTPSPKAQLAINWRDRMEKAVIFELILSHVVTMQNNEP